MGSKATMVMQPTKGLNLGAGPGVLITREVYGGAVGLMLDGRGRPLDLPTDQQARIELLTRWFNAVALYPTT
jgi:hypothetical protein